MGRCSFVASDCLLHQEGALWGVEPKKISKEIMCCFRMGPLHDPVTWYGINYAGTRVTQWDFQNKGTRTSPARLSFVLEVPLCNLRPMIIYTVPCDRIVQRAYWYLLGVKHISSHAQKTGSWYLIEVLFKFSDEHPRRFYMGGSTAKER